MMPIPHQVHKIAETLRLFVLACTALFIFAGCTTAPSKEAIPPFRKGVVTADQQTSAAFMEVNSFLRRQQIERALSKPTLTEDLFVEALDSADLAKWHRAFGIIDSYAEKLERLLDPNQRSGVEGELTTLGVKIESLGGEQLPAGVFAAINKLGGLLVKLKTERDALEAIRKADPAIQAVFGAMMEAIGSDSQIGVRGTVGRSWAQVLGNTDVKEFRVASNGDAKRAAVSRYVEQLDKRDAHDRLVSSLRLSLAALAKAHHEIAQGRNVSAAALIQLIQDEYKAYQEQLKAIRERQKDGATTGGAK